MNPPPPPPAVSDVDRARETTVQAVVGQPELMAWSHRQVLFGNVPAYNGVEIRRDVVLPRALPKLSLPLDPINIPFTLALTPVLIRLIITQVWIACVRSGLYKRANTVLTDEQIRIKIDDLMGSGLRLFTPGTLTFPLGTIVVGGFHIFAFRRERVTKTTRRSDEMYLFDGMTSKSLWLPVAYYAMKCHMAGNGFGPGRARYLATTYALQLIHISSGRSVELSNPLLKAPEEFEGVAW